MDQPGRRDLQPIASRAAEVLRRAASLALLVSLIACGGDEPSADDCGEPGSILAVNRNHPDEHGLAQVVVRHPDGSETLATGDWVATDPSFAPDGDRLVVVRAEGDYESAGPESTALWEIGVDGSDPRRLTDGRRDADPAWSPDGTQIAFSREMPDGQRDLYLLDLQTGSAAPLVTDPDVDERAPAWSPDGEAVAFVRTASGSSTERAAVSIINRDGTNEEELAAVPAHSLDWHPDQEQLLISTLGAERGDLLVLDIATGRVAGIDSDGTMGVWAPSGDSIYFFDHVVAAEGSSWRLSTGELDSGELTSTALVPIHDDYFMYPYFGMAAGPCESSHPS